MQCYNQMANMKCLLFAMCLLVACKISLSQVSDDPDTSDSSYSTSIATPETTANATSETTTSSTSTPSNDPETSDSSHSTSITTPKTTAKPTTETTTTSTPSSPSLKCSDPKCELMQNLTHSYCKDMLPDCPESGLPVEVNMELWLRQVVDLDEPKQILTTNVWIRMDWNDCRLRWNPDHYSGVKVLYSPFERIWTPDITLYDDSAFGSNIAMSERKFYQLEVYNTGQVNQRFPSVLKSVCGVDTTYFPYDKQTCPLKFGPWVYEFSEVNLTTEEDGNTDAYVENAEWVLNAVRCENVTTYYSPHNFTEVIYHVEIQRRPTFFMLTLFFPCFLICTMDVLGFVLPASLEQKVGLHLTLLLSLTVFEFLTLGIVPPNSESLPLMCEYFGAVMGFASLSCILSVFVMKIHHKGVHRREMYPWVKTLLVKKLGSLLCVKTPENETPDIGLRVMPVARALSGPIEHSEEENTFQDWVALVSVLDRLFLILYILLSLITFIVFYVNLAT